jgi:teichuronic acid biosynthesis glycosyltransferase TuaH
MLSVKSQSWDNLVVLCAANNYDTVKMADQHIAEELARLGPVLYVDPPLSFVAPFKSHSEVRRLTGPKIHIQGSNLARMTPIVGPFPGRPGMTALTTVLLRSYIQRAVRALQARSVRAVVSGWPVFSVFGSCREDVSLYWAQDDFVGGAALLGLDAAHIAKFEQRVSAKADFIVAANPLVAERWRNSGHETLLIPYGTAISAYSEVAAAALPSDVDLPHPIIGFVGHINQRIDLRLLEELTDRGRSLLLVGPKDSGFEPERMNKLLERPNVCWVGPKAFNDLPGYFRLIDVGLVPYVDNAFNRGCFPLKTLEYLSAGIPVVSTDLPATRWLATELIGVADEPEAFADLVDRVLGDASDPTLIARRRGFAGQHSYSARAAEFDEAIRGHQRRPSAEHPVSRGSKISG